MNLANGPINYTQTKSAFDKVLEGYKAGTEIRKGEEEQRNSVLAKQQAMQMQKELASVANNPNAGAKDYAALITKYPTLSEHFKRSWDILNTDQQQNKLKQASQVHSALISGKPDIAKQLLKEQADAFRNSGKEQEAKATEAMIRTIDVAPNVAASTTSLMLAATMGPEQYAKTFETLEKQRSLADLQPLEKQKLAAEAKIKSFEAENTPERLALENYQSAANVKNIYSQIDDRANRLSLDKDKLTSDVQQKLLEYQQNSGKIDDNAKKIVNDSTIAAITASQSSGQMRTLADELEKAAVSAGVYAKGSELYKKVVGNQDAVTNLRQEYIRLRNTQVIKTLPPGPATDRDIEIAMKGFPDDTADAKMMASFLRGMAKMADLEEVNESAKAEWVNLAGHLGKAKTDITIDGVQVPAGTNFLNFAKDYVPKKVKSTQQQKTAEKSLEKVGSRNYLKYADQ